MTHVQVVVDTATVESLDIGSPCDEKNYLQLDDDERRHFVSQLSDVFWHLHTTRPVNVLTAPAGMPGALSKIMILVTSHNKSGQFIQVYQMT